LLILSWTFTTKPAVTLDIGKIMIIIVADISFQRGNLETHAIHVIHIIHHNMENMPMDNLVPTTGNSASVIDRLLEYIPKFDPDFSNRISGAPSDMISLYSKLAGFGGTIDDIPIAYANFLRSNII
jgi:hypothetical protein